MEHHFLSKEENLDDLTCHSVSETYNRLYYSKKNCQFYRLNEITSNYSLKKQATFHKLYYISKVNSFFILLEILRFEKQSFEHITTRLKFVLDDEYLKSFKDSLCKIKYLQKFVEIDGPEEQINMYRFDRKEVIKHVQSMADKLSKSIDFNDFTKLGFIKSQIDKNKWKPRKQEIFNQKTKQKLGKGGKKSGPVQSGMGKFVTTIKKTKTMGAANIYKDFVVGDVTRQTFCFNILGNYIDKGFLKEILEWDMHENDIYKYLN